MAIGIDPAAIGLSTGTIGPVWGVVMDTVMADGTWYSLVTLADGTTSLYTSGTFGVIGAGQHESVRAASEVLLSMVRNDLGMFRVASDSALPPRGSVAIRAMTFDGQRVVVAVEDDLGHGRHPAAQVFHAAHGVIGQVRQLA
jgi:hypothetical protein